MQVINNSATKSYTIGGYTIAPGVQRFVPDDYYVDMKSIADLAVVGSPPSSSGRQTVVPLYGAVDPSGRVSQVTTASGAPVSGVGGEWRFEYPIAAGFWGDSLTDVCTATTHDLTSAPAATFNGATGRLPRERLAAALLYHSRGRLIPVNNSGLGGSISTGIVGRDADPAGINRRGAQDATNMGARVCILSLGVNDIIGTLNLDTLTPTARNTILQTVYTNTVTAVRRVQQLGMYPMLRELPGFAHGFGSHTPASAAAGAMMLKEAAEHIANVIVPTLGDMFLIRYREICVDPVTGAWYPQYSNDKLHDNFNSVAVLAKLIDDHLATMARPITDTAYAPLPAGSGRVNGFAAPSMISVTNGIAAGFEAASASNRTTIVGSVTDDENGVRWQNFLLTPVTFDGSARALAPNGLSSVLFTIKFTDAFGATPVLPLALGDVFRIECDVVIESVDGGAPSVLTWSANSYIAYGSGQTFSHSAMFAPATDADLVLALEANDGKLVTLPLVAPAASADITAIQISLTTYAGSTVPYRVRFSAPRLVKYQVARP